MPYPTSIDAFANPNALSLLENVDPALDHNYQHTHLNTELLAVERHIGANSSPAISSLEYLLQTGSGIASDDMPLSPRTEDDEFTGTSLAGKWSIINSGITVAESITFDRSWFCLTMPATNLTADRNRFIVQTIQSSTSIWFYAAKMLFQFDHREGTGAFLHSGIFLRNSTSGKYESWGLTRRGSNISEQGIWQWNPTDTFAGTQAGKPQLWGTYYVGVELVGGVINFYYSEDGIAWGLEFTQTLGSHFLTSIDQVGVGLMCYNSAYPVKVGCDWLRRLI